MWFKLTFLNCMQLEIPATINSSAASDSDQFPVKVEPSSKALKILALDSGIQIGSGSLACSLAVCRLREKAKVVLTASVVVPAPRRQSQYIRATLRIVVFGFMSEEQAVAKTLSDGDLYLQHPSLSECDCQVPYFNPQYLLRPGGSMPKLEDLTISGRRRPVSGAHDTLSEVEKTQLLQIFESAHDPDATFGVRPSPRLQSVLKEYHFPLLLLHKTPS